MNPAPPRLHYIYLLGSCKKGWIYIGFTSDLSRRIQEHYSGKNYSTRKYLPIELIYCEGFSSITDAKDREKSLKQHGNTLRLLKKRIKRSLNIIYPQHIGGAG